MGRREGGCNLHSLGAELGEGRGDSFEAAEEDPQKQRVGLFSHKTILTDKIYESNRKTQGQFLQTIFVTSLYV